MREVELKFQITTLCLTTGKSWRVGEPYYDSKEEAVAAMPPYHKWFVDTIEEIEILPVNKENHHA